MEKHHSADFTMNGLFLNIINGFFFCFSTMFALIGANLSTITALISSVFLVVLNARKAAIEVKRWHRIATGKEELIDDENGETGNR
jgi:uncharacterized membrane protein YhaH (DUF805 family)